MSDTCSLFPLETPGLPACYPLKSLLTFHFIVTPVGFPEKQNTHTHTHTHTTQNKQQQQ